MEKVSSEAFIEQNKLTTSIKHCQQKSYARWANTSLSCTSKSLSVAKSLQKEGLQFPTFFVF
ncbi:MAG: hypothetical protein EAZ92_01780 [Candidatus Kapaibacterium sp.]|nr:MAG: hypothetical protein EAZ92_01780 [Candidatus Kapabacteria bacterium]